MLRNVKKILKYSQLLSFTCFILHVGSLRIGDNANVNA